MGFLGGPGRMCGAVPAKKTGAYALRCPFGVEAVMQARSGWAEDLLQPLKSAGIQVPKMSGN